MPTLTDRITAAVAAYPAWSPAERRRLDAITEEMLAHVRDGCGNYFVAQWCLHALPLLLADQEKEEISV